MAQADERLNALIARVPALRQRQMASDSVRRSRQRPLGRPLADFAGSYENEALGTIVFSLSKGALRFRWGVLGGPTEVFDATKDPLRIEIAGSGNVVSFRFNGPGAAKSIDVGGGTFVRR